MIVKLVFTYCGHVSMYGMLQYISIYGILTVTICPYMVNIHVQVTVSTIAGSRHVGPIKPRVEEWGKQLAVFSETLVRSLQYVHVSSLHNDDDDHDDRMSG